MDCDARLIDYWLDSREEEVVNDDYWALAEKTSERIKSWPEWKRNITVVTCL